MSIGRDWSLRKIVGWIFDTPQSLKDTYLKSRNASDYADLLQTYEQKFESTMSPIFFKTSIKLNLGGENDKARLEFTDQPQGIFDFASASSSLYRIAEYYSDEIAKLPNNIFENFMLPLGIVPNNFVQNKVINGVQEFYYEDKINNKTYLCEQRQMGLTKALLEDPTLPLSKQGTMTIADVFVKSAKFGSRTKKPYVRYKKRGGKVKYVEIYSLNHYQTMDGDFFKSSRHLPAIMVLDYLEKQGTTCKFYITRFVDQSVRTSDPIREFDLTTNAKLPLYDCAKTDWKRLSLIPKCVKDYGEPIDYSFIFGVGGEDTRMYESIYTETITNEFEQGASTHAYGKPIHPQYLYEEGFERFRQKYIKYVKEGIWKGKEVKPQGLIMFYDSFLNNNFESLVRNIKNIIRSENLLDNSVIIPRNTNDVVKDILKNLNFQKWFELSMKISAFVIKHRLDVYNTNNFAKMYREVEKEIDEMISEMDLLIRNEPNTNAKRFYQDWRSRIIRNYIYDDIKLYVSLRIDEMTFYAEGGCFPTPPEQIEEREKEAKALRDELKKI
jgi:hypothetical protein